MTIIAYRDGLLASDTLITTYGTRVAHAKKLDRVRDWMIGGAGRLGVLVPVRAWVDEGAELGVPIDWGKLEDSVAILINPQGEVFFAGTENPYVTPEYFPFTALGSGGDIGRGVMYHGGSAIDAVRAAIHLDVSCGGSILTMALGKEEQDNLELPKEFYKAVNHL